MTAGGRGESNLDPFQGAYPGARAYGCRMRAAVDDWRALLRSPALPLVLVELAACNSYPTKPINAAGWAYMREAQRAGLDAPATALATAIDAGFVHGAVHSPLKQPVGVRIGLQLLRLAYGRTDLVASGPALAAAPAPPSPSPSPSWAARASRCTRSPPPLRARRARGWGAQRAPLSWGGRDTRRKIVSRNFVSCLSPLVSASRRAFWSSGWRPRVALCLRRS